MRKNFTPKYPVYDTIGEYGSLEEYQESIANFLSEHEFGIVTDQDGRVFALSLKVGLNYLHTEEEVVIQKAPEILKHLFELRDAVSESATKAELGPWALSVLNDVTDFLNQLDRES